MTQLESLLQDTKNHSNPQKQDVYKRFFKTGKGEYGEGDKFYGLTVPQCRSLAITYKTLEFKDLQLLFQSKIHEERLIALLILVEQFKTAYTDKNRRRMKQLYGFYLAHTQYINNWDLVDLSAHKIVGDYLLVYPNKRKVLYRLAKSNSLWEKRIAIISTFAFLPQKDCKDALALSKLLLSDSHDLIHKAVGWVLREVGKNCGEEILEDFIKTHYKQMSRTTLRYAIERFPENKRKNVLKGIFI